MNDTTALIEITFDQASQEINAVNRALALAIGNQSNAGDVNAWTIIDLYRKGVRMTEVSEEEAEAARVTFCKLYGAWRMENPELVAPIAEALGNPLPFHTGPAPSETPPGSGDLFGSGPAPAATVPGPTSPSETGEAAQETPIVGLTQPAPTETAKGGRRTRRNWTQAEIVTLTRTLLTAGSAPLPAVAAFAAASQRTPEEVTDKAVELELLTPAVVPAKNAAYEVSESDKRVLRSRILTALVPENVSDDLIRLALYKAAMVELREIIKGLAQ